jgi:hypothetical protein
MKRANAAGKPLKVHSPERSYTQEILTRLVRILLMSGESKEALTREFAEICRRATLPKARPLESTSLELDHAHVISHWFSQPEYLDANGVPRALPLTGRRASVTALVNRALPGANPALVLEALQKLDAVREDAGTYRPTSYYVPFEEGHEAAMRWVLTVLRGVLQAMEHNAFARPEDRLPGRAAINPSFPVRALASFHDRLRDRVSVFLQNTDTDMHRKEARAGDEPTTRLGVAVLAFEDPPVTGTPEGTRGRDRIHPKPGRARPRGKRR